MQLQKATTTTIKYMKSRGLSPATLDGYGMGLRLFSRYLKERGIKAIDEVAYQDMIEYINYLQTRPRLDGKPGNLATETINSHIKALRGMFQYLHAAGALAHNPAEKITYFRNKRRVIKSFSSDQLKALFSVIPTTFSGRRDRLLFLLLLDCGLRISEALGLRAKDIFFGDKLMKVLGKGSKERLVPFGLKLKSGLESWIEEHSLSEERYIFFCQGKKSVTSACIRNHLRRYGQQAGITGVRVRPHIFRHTFAVFFLRNGGNPFVLKRILGHTTLYMTERYVDLLVEDLQREHAQFGPGDRLEI